MDFIRENAVWEKLGGDPAKAGELVCSAVKERRREGWLEFPGLLCSLRTVRQRAESWGPSQLSKESCVSQESICRSVPAALKSLACSSHWIVWPLWKPSPGSPSTAAGALATVFSLCESSAGACWRLTQKPVLLSHRLLVNQQKTCQNIPCKTAKT